MFNDGTSHLLRIRFFLGSLAVLVATTTLALGVNLPARLVIVKGTNHYRGGAKGYEELPRLVAFSLLGCFSWARAQLTVGNSRQCQTHGKVFYKNEFSSWTEEAGDIVAYFVSHESEYMRLSSLLPWAHYSLRTWWRSAILQMIGRAGRPGFDSSGVAVVMTSQV